jgi:hypothetical protein
MQGSLAFAFAYDRRDGIDAAIQLGADYGWPFTSSSNDVRLGGRWNEAQHPSVFPVGSRALIALGTTFWGYAQPRRMYVADAHVGDGRPTSGASHLQAVGRRRFPINRGSAWPTSVTMRSLRCVLLTGALLRRS